MNEQQLEHALKNAQPVRSLQFVEHGGFSAPFEVKQQVNAGTVRQNFSPGFTKLESLAGQIVCHLAESMGSKERAEAAVELAQEVLKACAELQRPKQGESNGK